MKQLSKKSDPLVPNGSNIIPTKKMPILQNWALIGKKLPVLSVNYQAKEA